MHHISAELHKKEVSTKQPITSAILADGSIVEMLFDPRQTKTQFAFWTGEAWNPADSVRLNAISEGVPYSPLNTLVSNRIVLFPSEPLEYGDNGDLVREIQSFIHRYVDASPTFERLASYYVLFSWVYDNFNELPYLRVRGDPGCGKTRFLLTVGSICYKPIFASGASTISPIFRMLDLFHGTLVIDESDFRMSDEKAEMVKIFNNGNVRGFPVLRSEQINKGEFCPKAYQVFGPKIVATRGSFDDKALESRFLTEELGQSRLRGDIPINLPNIQADEALVLRNKLLLFRFRNLQKVGQQSRVLEGNVEPRLKQILSPLLAVIDDQEMRDDLVRLAASFEDDLIASRGMTLEAHILTSIRSLMESQPESKFSVGDITARLNDLYSDEYDQKFTTKRIGWIIRERLHLRTQKSHGVFVLPPEEKAKLPLIYKRYGVETSAPEYTKVGNDKDDGDVIYGMSDRANRQS